MDTDVVAPIEILSEDNCWALLSMSSLGRLAVSVADEPSIYPVNFLVVDQCLLFRTSPGTKLAELTVNHKVAFEADGLTADEAWSVVVKGTARVLDQQSDIDAAADLALSSVIPTDRYVYVEVTPHEVTGRRFEVGQRANAAAPRERPPMSKTSLGVLGRTQLEAARSASSGRASRTVYGGHEHSLRQTVIALVGGEELREHESPGEATLHVLAGQIELRAGDVIWDGAPGDLLTIPDARHSLAAKKDSVVLLTVAK
jgi:nitroimidazol reductase NimA-like FMN-containing flavoprotein (pyridoxamine 5'-phosphate oxidase superfamily)/quercetin dioxygenase-like cupin family protein